MANQERSIQKMWNWNYWRWFERNNLAERKNKFCRKASGKFLKFKEKWGLDPFKTTKLNVTNKML